ncbi:MAG TPA: response regulator [Longimicrobiales bacterium]|nr:response regulator [Longimicrobiales bacterium]
MSATRGDAVAGTRRVFVVDDDDFTRAVLERIITAAGLEVRTFRLAREFLENGCHLKPGCLVLDMCLPDLDGLEVQARLLADGSFMPIIFLTGFGDVSTAVQAMKAGAIDFLRKPVAVKALLASIDAALAEEARVRKERADQAAARRRYERLTPREQEVFHHVVAGLLNKQIAREMGVTEKTVKFHRARVMEKMGVRRLAQLVHEAGLLEEAIPPDA